MKQAKLIINNREEVACFSQPTDPDYSRKHNISKKTKPREPQVSFIVELTSKKSYTQISREHYPERLTKKCLEGNQGE